MALDDLMVFVHIEKCAGTAVNSWFNASHRLGNLYVRHSDVPMTSLPWSKVSPGSMDDREIRSLASHHLRTYPAAVHGRALHYITILRDPIARWISFVRFFYVLRGGDENGPLITLREHAEALLAKPPQATLAEINGQLNFLAEHEWYRAHRDDAIAIDWSAEPALFDAYRRERLPFALDLLERFEAVGVVERLDDFVRVLRARAAAWDVPLVPVTNIPPMLVTDRPPVDAAFITPADSVGRRLLDAFAEEFELYARANARLTQDLARVR